MNIDAVDPLRDGLLFGATALAGAVNAIAGGGTLLSFPAALAWGLPSPVANATNALATFRGNMERHFQDRRTYETSGDFKTPCELPLAQRTVGDFVVSCSEVEPTTYTLQAAGSGSTAGFSYTVDEQDTRTSTTPWGNCGTRWILKRGQTC